MVSGSPDYLQHISLTCTFSPNLCFGTLIISSVCVSLLQYMHTNVPDVFCGGDLAMFPLAMAKNRMVNIGHWQMAQAQGKAGNIDLTGKFHKETLMHKINVWHLPWEAQKLLKRHLSEVGLNSREFWVNLYYLKLQNWHQHCQPYLCSLLQAGVFTKHSDEYKQ